ncbi:MAG: TIGR03619 family F420-dependent LLM class oxidoreductase [Caulobacter sp.]
MSVQVSIFFRPYQSPGGDLSVCLDVARAMDEAGIHSVIFGDHLLLGENLKAYPYGAFLHPAESAWMEPLTTLAAMAAVTKTLKLATGILIAPLRHPVLLAKTIATLDVISGGRTQLALGVGWQKEEYDALGLPFEERYARLEESVRACRAIWGEQPVNFESENVHVTNSWALPRPLQARVPLLLGLNMTGKNARRMAELADGWCPVGLTPVQIREGVDRLAEALTEVGRDLSDQHIRVGIPHVTDADGKVDVRRSLAAIPEYADAGGTILTIASPPNPDSLAELMKFIDEVGQVAREYAEPPAPAL